MSSDLDSEISETRSHTRYGLSLKKSVASNHFTEGRSSEDEGLRRSESMKDIIHRNRGKLIMILIFILLTVVVTQLWIHFFNTPSSLPIHENALKQSHESLQLCIESQTYHVNNQITYNEKLESLTKNLELLQREVNQTLTYMETIKINIESVVEVQSDIAIKQSLLQEQFKLLNETYLDETEYRKNMTDFYNTQKQNFEIINETQSSLTETLKEISQKQEVLSHSVQSDKELIIKFQSLQESMLGYQQKINILSERLRAESDENTARAAEDEEKITCLSQSDVEEAVTNYWNTNIQTIKSEMNQQLQQKKEQLQRQYDELTQRLTAPEVSAATSSESVSGFLASTDFAQPGAGALVVHKLTSPTYNPYPPNTLKWLATATRSSLGLETDVGQPEELLSPDLRPGSCWAMQGSEGYVTIRLIRPVVVKDISIEHLPRSASLDIRSAPKDFEAYGLASPTDEEPKLLVSGSYSISVDQESRHRQTFPVELRENYNHRFEYIRVNFRNNHGHPNYTCIYKIRVHGYDNIE